TVATESCRLYNLGLLSLEREPLPVSNQAQRLLFVQEDMPRKGLTSLGALHAPNNLALLSAAPDSFLLCYGKCQDGVQSRDYLIPVGVKREYPLVAPELAC